MGRFIAYCLPVSQPVNEEKWRNSSNFTRFLQFWLFSVGESISKYQQKTRD